MMVSLLLSYKRGNMKAFIFLLLCLLLTKPLSAFGINEEVTFTDDLKRNVTVSEPKRTAVLLGSFAEIWILSGGSVCASADDAWEDYHLDLRADTYNLGNTKNLNLEILLASNPDFIIASTNSKQHLEWMEILDRIGIPVAYFDVSDFNGYLNMLKICTMINGREDLFQKNGIQIQEDTESIIQRCQEKCRVGKTPSVLLLRYSAARVRAKNSEGNVPGEMLKSLGCINIADSNSMLLEELSLEAVIKEDPDYIFLVQMGDSDNEAEINLEHFLNENPVWNSLTAVKENHVFRLDKLMFGLRPNNRWAEALEILEKDIFDDENE